MKIKNLYNFPSDFRLLVRSDFLFVQNNGKKFYTKNFIVIFLHKDLGPTRIGITVSKKVGGAVQRNRIKRIIREIVRCCYKKIGSQVDISIIAKKGASNISFSAACDELKKLLTG